MARRSVDAAMPAGPLRSHPVPAASHDSARRQAAPASRTAHHTLFPQPAWPAVRCVRCQSSSTPARVAKYRAVRSTGTLCSQTRPGPVRVAEKKPSPPKMDVLRPPTRAMS